MRDLSELGIEQDGSVTDEMVATVQDHIGVEFPADYVFFVKYCDEAEPTVGGIQFGDEETMIDSFFKFSDEEQEEYGILGYVGIPGFPKKVIPFARDPGDAFFCLDMNRAGAVVFYNPDTEKWSQVAETFGEFIDMLIEL